MSRYAVNICDLSALASPGGFNPVPLLLQDFVSPAPSHVTTNKHMVDSGALILDGPAISDPERVTALIALLQTVIGPRKLGRRIRCYQEGARGGWRELRPQKEEGA